MAVQETPTRLYTAVEFFSMSGWRKRELRAGQVVSRTPHTFGDGEILVNLGHELVAYTRECGNGHALLSAHFLLKREPDSVLMADIALVDTTSLTKLGVPRMAVNIVPFEETWSAVEQRVRLFLEAGTETFWLVNKSEAEIHIRTQDNMHHVYSRQDTIDGGTLLPGFKMPLSEVFDQNN